MKENICTAAGVIGGFFVALLGTARRLGFRYDHTDYFHGYRLHDRTDCNIYGQKQAQQDRQAQFKGRLGGTCEEILHSAHGCGGSENGYSYRYDIYP